MPTSRHNPDREPADDGEIVNTMCWEYRTRIEKLVDEPLCPTCHWYVQEKGKWYCTGQTVIFQPDAENRDPCDSYRVKVE